MNNYGNMAGSIRRVAEYQKVDVQHVPGYGENCYRITVHEGRKHAGDVFEIRTDAHLNHALNVLLNRAIYNE